MAASVAQPVTSAAPAAQGWLFGPVPDLLLGCGLLYLLGFPLLAAIGPELREAQPKLLFPILLLLTSTPHYGATLLRVYEQAAERRRYAFFTLWCTLAVVAWYAAGLWVPAVGSVLITLYLTWSPWHYTGQNYGLAVMFLRRNGVAFDARDKRWLYASFLSTYALVFLVLHVAGASTPGGYGSYALEVQPLGIPRAWNAWLVPLVCGAYLVCLARCGYGLARRAPLRALLPTGLLVLTQAIWFVAPFAVIHFQTNPVIDVLDWRHRQYYVGWIAAGHAIQYLWVTTYYARHSSSWRGGAVFYAKVLASSAALWTGVPILLGPAGAGFLTLDAGLFVLTAAAINVHHFILDGAIWKLRGRIAEILIRSGRDEDAIAAPRGWTRRVVWACCALALSLSAWSLLEDEVSRRAIVARDAQAALSPLDRLAVFGLDAATHRRSVGALLFERGEFGAARAQFERSLALAPSREAYLGLARVAARSGRFVESAEFAEAALAGQPHDLALLVGTARSWIRAGQPARAMPLLQRAETLHPGDRSIAAALAEARRAAR